VHHARPRARADASSKALDTLFELGVDLGRPIDIFDIIERSRIWLMFQPMPRLYGVYLPVDATPGIIINSNHPLGLQRFTAAHEFGHYILQHGPTIDDQRRIGPGRPPDTAGALKEIAAQAFAAGFLMPLELVNVSMRGLGMPLEPSGMTPRQVYLLALELGVSYAAMASQLVVLHKVSPAEGAQLRKIQPQMIKRDLGRGTRPEDPWADAWPVGPADSGRLLRPRVGDEIRISLPETPSTGYVWTCPHDLVQDQRLESASDSMAHVPLSLVDNDFEPSGDPKKGLLGAGGWRHLVLRVNQPGNYTLQLGKRRRWQKTAAPVEVFKIDIGAVARRTGDYDSGLSERQKPFLPSAA
jgi:Zn-dependent peptidase ImmA (M78 family)/predicted secreted protein